MHVTIPHRLLQYAIGDASDAGRDHDDSVEESPLGLLCGRRLDDGDVLQVVGLWEPTPNGESPPVEAIGARLGTSVDRTELTAQSQYYHHATNEEIEGLLPISLSKTAADRLIDEAGPDAVLVADRGDLDVPVLEDSVRLERGSTGDHDSGASVDVIRYGADAFSRNESLLDSDLLEDAAVTVVGLGTGGSTVAVELAKAGVGTFHLVDFDRLETHNITRHVCGLSDVGRRKTRAVRDRVLDVNPTATVRTHEIDVLEAGSDFTEIVAESDLVIGATDSESSKLSINRTCIEEGVSAVYAGAYERAFGGDVIRVIPEETPCYDCILGDLQDSLDYTDETEAIDYAAVEDPESFTAEPGLSVDVGFISLIQTKFALLTLLRGSDSELDDFETNMCFWGNRPEWIFEEPLQSQFAETRFRENCPTCQRETYFESEHGMTEDEAKDRVEELVSDADSLELPSEEPEHSGSE